MRWVSVFSFSLLLLIPADGVESGNDVDFRDIQTGLQIPDEGYCDQPYVVVTGDGSWLCTLTTGPGKEGDRGQHVVSTISTDRGKTWSKLVDIEPSSGPEASWAVPLVTPGGRVYAFYTYNGDHIDALRGKKIRADVLGWYAYKYSDDHGRSWSRKRHRLPLRLTACDRGNDWKGEVQLFWGICKPIVVGQDVLFTFTKLGKYILDDGEGWMFRSENLLVEKDPEKIRWELSPEGDRGIRSDAFGSVQEEHNLVSLGGERLYVIYRTTTGHPCHSYSSNGGRTWTRPEHMTYTPGGRKIKNPRACPRIWRAKNGKFLLWFHNHSGRSYHGRNPVWISGGVERDGHLHWSQPEILFYGADPDTRMSYPDLIEEDGRYWITETQKTVARVHEVDRRLLEGLWDQGAANTVSSDGVILQWRRGGSPSVNIARREDLDLRGTGGLAIEIWLVLDTLKAGQVLIENRGAGGRGIAIATGEGGTIQLELKDGTSEARWHTDPGILKARRLHHLVAIADGGPQIISFLIDGILCDGGSTRQYGWGRWNGRLGDLSGSGEFRIAPSMQGRIETLRVYRRYLRTSEAVAHYRAGAE